MARFNEAIRLLARAVLTFNCLTTSISAAVVTPASPNSRTDISFASNAVFTSNPRDCSTFDPANPPFPGAVCRETTKPDGANTTILVNNLYIPSEPSTYTAALDDSNGSSKWCPDASGYPRSLCDVADTVYSAKSNNPYAPRADDCLVVHQWARNHPGHWIVSKADMGARKWTALVISGSCAFVVGASKEYGKKWGLAVGNTDVQNLVRESMSNYEARGALQVLGNTKCLTWTNEGDGWTMVPTDWYIVRPDSVDLGSWEAAK